MNDTKKRDRIFYGWWLVIIPSIMTGLGSNFYTSGMSILFKPIAAELGLSRAATSIAMAIGRLEGGLDAPLTGWLSDKYGPKWLMIAGLCLMVGGLIFVSRISAPWTYYVAWGLMMGMGNNISLTITVDKVISNWFIARRGFAFGIRFALIGICGVIVLPIISMLVVNQGWRTTCLIWAVIMSVGIPLTFFLIKQKRPEHYGLFPDGATYTDTAETDSEGMYRRGVEYAESYQEHEFTIKQAVKTRAYWLMCIAWSFNILVWGGFNVHCVPFLTDMGIPLTVAGGMMSLMIFFTIPSRFFAGFLADRVGKDRLKFIAAGAFAIEALGIIVFLVHPSVIMAYALLILFGFGNGATTPLRLSMGGRFFGRKAFASILGSTMLITAPVSMIAPIYTGWIYDRTGDYSFAFMLFSIFLVCASLLVCFVPAPKPPEQAADYRRFM